MKILNIHGYHSSNHNSFDEALRACGYEVFSPLIDYDTETPYDIIRKLKEIYEREQCNAVTGSSMGGFFSIQLCIEKNCPIVVSNPCLMPFEVLPRIGYENNQGIKEYITLFSNIAKINKNKVTAIVGDSDELLGDHRFTKWLLGNERYQVIPGGQHRSSTLPLKEILQIHGNEYFGIND